LNCPQPVFKVSYCVDHFRANSNAAGPGTSAGGDATPSGADPYLPKLRELVTRPVEEQGRTFLRAFVADFQGKFETVLEEIDAFRLFPKRGSDGQLDEIEASHMLEKRGLAKTALEFREQMRLIDLNYDKRVSVIEWLLFWFKKTTKDLFENKPNAMLIKQLEEAIAAHEAVFKAKKERADKIAELEAAVAAGGAGAAKARAELMRLKGHDASADGANEINALAKKLKAKRALANPDEESKRMQEEAFKEEQARVAEEKRRAENEAKRKRDESRAKLAAKASAFGK